MIGIYLDKELDSIEDKEELMDLFEEMEYELISIKWRMAKLWMFGTEDLTDEQQLEAAGLI